MRIVTSINVYNFHVIISYLEEGIDIIKFELFKSRLKNIPDKYVDKISNVKTLTELTPISHHLLGIEHSILKNISLREDRWQKSQEINAAQITYDFNSKLLYVLSEDNVIQEINPNIYRNLKVKNKFSSETLEKHDPLTISNMRNYFSNILLSIRGFGATTILNEREERVFRTEDAQDVILLSDHKTIAVADITGVLLFRDFEKPIKAIKLPDYDFPQELVAFNKRLLIKGKNGLYLYDLQNEKLSQIWKQKVGAFATYFNMIFLCSQNKIYMISHSNETVEHFKYQNTDLGIETIKYFR